MVPKLQRRLCGPLVIAKQAAEPLMAFNGTAATEGSTTWLDQSIDEPLVIPLDVIVLDILADDAPRWRSPSGITWPTHSVFADRANRSA
jgi:hypothetical protein